MNNYPSIIYNNLREIREKQPLVHSITNYVVMNSTANALLALGASPIMAHATDEVEEIIDLAHSLVVNIGTLSNHWIEGMLLAAKRASVRKIPIILDPVGAGATPYRTSTVHRLLESVKPSVIRGNPSEIIAIYHNEKKTTKGVDSLHRPEDALQPAQALAKLYQCTISVSGVTDIIVEEDIIVKVENGNEIMPYVTGFGCTASALTAAFSAVTNSGFEGALSAMVTMGIAGEIAAEKANGPGSMQMHFIDALYNLQEQDYHKRIRIKHNEGALSRERRDKLSSNEFFVKE